jgi:hypothetical protein
MVKKIILGALAVALLGIGSSYAQTEPKKEGQVMFYNVIYSGNKELIDVIPITKDNLMQTKEGYIYYSIIVSQQKSKISDRVK